MRLFIWLDLNLPSYYLFLSIYLFVSFLLFFYFLKIEYILYSAYLCYAPDCYVLEFVAQPVQPTLQ